MSFGIPFEEVLGTIFDTIWTPTMIQNERAIAPAQQLETTVNNASGYTSGKSKTRPIQEGLRLRNRYAIRKRFEIHPNIGPSWGPESLGGEPHQRWKHRGGNLNVNGCDDPFGPPSPPPLLTPAAPAPCSGERMSSQERRGDRLSSRGRSRGRSPARQSGCPPRRGGEIA